MCCRSSVFPIPESWPLVLEMAGFKPVQPDRLLTPWWRELDELHSIHAVLGMAPNHGLAFTLHPSIGSHLPDDHERNATSAAILFKVLMTLAEQAEGQVLQQTLVGECRRESGRGERVLASYPSQPLRWENLCVGFRTVLLRGVSQIGE
jgi:hypothetical protein